LSLLIKKTGFRVIKNEPVLSFEYGPWGFAASVLKALGIEGQDVHKGFGGIAGTVLLLLLLPAGLVWTLFLYMFGDSSIGILVARKVS
jgi:hypothetical protein